MKKIKIILSFLLIFIMIAGIMPVVHAEDGITITGLNLPVNMTKSVKFYLTGLPTGFDVGNVLIDDTVVRTFNEHSYNYYTLELTPANYLTPGTHVVKIMAGDVVATKEVEFYYPAFVTTDYSTDINSLSGLASLTIDTVKEALNLDAISLGTNSGTTLAASDKGSGDYALAFVREESSASNKNAYFEKALSATVDNGIVELEFSAYRVGGAISYLRISGAPCSDINIAGNISADNKWFDVRLILNLDERTYACEIDNRGGEIAQKTGSLTKDSMEMSKIRIYVRPKDNTANVSVTFDDLKIKAYTPAKKDVMITSPADGDSLDASDALAVNVSARESDSVTLYVDGKEIQTYSASDESGDYAVSVNSQDIGRGIKNIRLVAFSGTTPVGADSVNVNLTGHSALSTAANGNFQDFNTMTALEAKSDATTLEAFTANYGWEVAQGYLSLSRTTGHTGEEGDWAPLFQHFAPGQNANNNAKISLDGADVSAESVGGRLVYDFWFKKYTVDNLYFWSVALWHDEMTFVKDGKLNGTDCEIKAGEWYHFKMILDRDVADENGKGLWYVYINDALVVNGGRQGTNSNMKGKGISFVLSKNAKTNTIPAGIAIDDARVYLEKDDPTIESVICTNADSETSSVEGTVSTDAKSISLTLSKALAVSDDNVELYVDGNLAAHSGVSVSGKMVTVNLPKLSASSDVKVVIRNTIEGLKTDLSVYFNVTDEIGFYAKAVNYNISDDAAGALVHCITPADMSANAYVATYLEECLEELSVKPITIKEGKSFTAIANNGLSAFETAKIMLWDANLKPIISPVSNK